MSDADWKDDPHSGDGWVDDNAHPAERPWYDISGKGLARGAIDALPILGGAGGGFLGSAAGPVGTVGGGALGYAGGKELADILKNRLLGDDATSVDPVEQVKRVSGNLVTGAEQEMGGQVTGKALGYAGDKLSQGAQAAGGGLRKVAGKLAQNATGATGLQASKFADDAGNQLLDRGLIKFGDNAANIAQRTGAAMDDANAAIDGVLKSLDAKGVTASQDNIVKELQSKIAELQKDPSQAGVVRKLNGIVDDIIQTGESNVPVSSGEKIKRGFNKMAGNWMDPEAGQAGKQAYLGYMDEVERAAQEADPSLAEKFTDAKKTYGLLAPIEEAASRRASTVGQSPFGGLGDMAAASTGALTGGPVGSALGVAAKKTIAPRMTSSAAVVTDKISKALLKSPQMVQLFQKNPTAFQSLVGQMEKKMAGPAEYAPMQQHFQKTAGDDREDVAANSQPDFNEANSNEALIQKAQGTKYGQVLQNAAQRGDQALAATHFILQGKDPEYRKLLDEEQNGEEDSNGDQ